MLPLLVAGEKYNWTGMRLKALLAGPSSDVLILL